MLDPATEDATRSWGALVAQHLVADYQIIAWTGAKQDPYPLGQKHMLEMIMAQILNESTPTVPQLFNQQIAGNSSSQIEDFTQWIPQVFRP